MEALKKRFKDISDFPFDFVYQDKKKPNSELPVHFHDLYEIFYVHSGKGSVFVSNHFYEISSGDLYIIPRDVIHHTIPSIEEPPTISALYFDACLVHENFNNQAFNYLTLFYIARESNDYKLNLSVAHQHLTEHILTKMFHELTERRLGYQSAIVQSIRHILLSLSRLHLSQEPILTGNLESGPKWMKDTLSFIDQNLDQPLTLSCLAKRAYVSPEHFSRVFKKLTGMTLSHYVNSKKIIQAKSILSTTNQNIANIAEKIGFKNTTHFYRMFKKSVGLTPSAYRKKNTRYL